MTSTGTTRTVDDLLHRNHRFADSHDVAGLPLLPTNRTIVVSCVDPRTDPAVMMGVDLGEAAVIRNIAGRITPTTLRTLALLAAIARDGGVAPGDGWNLVVVHHTDCGITRLVGFPDALAAELGVAPDALDLDTLTDPRASLRADLAALHSNPMLPRGLIVSGLLYDVDTGLLETVVAPAALGD